MNKFVYIYITALILCTGVHAQNSKFYLNNTTATTTNGDCATLQQLKVTFPVPANVSAYDCYYINLNLSSLDVPAYIYFDKADIKAKLAGKNEYKADIVRTDGTSDFTFDDTSLTMRDLCFLPRIWEMEELELSLLGTGHKIIGYHWEDQWDENQEKWISSKIAEWDDGTSYGSGTFVIKQRPVTDGIDDATGFVKIKPAGNSHIGFGEPLVAGTISTLSLSDTSLGIPVEFTWCVYNASEYPKEKVKNDLLAAFTGETSETSGGNDDDESQLFGGYQDAFQYMGEFSYDHVIPVNGKLAKAFDAVTMAGVSYDHVAFRQKFYMKQEPYSNKLQSGMYMNCYVSTIGDKTVAIIVNASDVLSEEYVSASFREHREVDEPEPDWFTARVTNEKISSIDALIVKTISGTTYNQ